MRKYLTEKNIRMGLIVSLIIFMGLFFHQCGKAKNNSISYEQNIAALTDSIRTYKTETGKLVYQKKTLISTSERLRKYNSNLSKKIKELENNPITITKFKTKIIRDTVKVYVYTHDPVWDLDSTQITFNYEWADSNHYSDGNYRYLSGNFINKIDTSFSVTYTKMKIFRDEIGLSFTTGLQEGKNGLAEIYIQSDYPGFKPISIEGALIDPRESDIIRSYFPPKRWGIGVYGGYGFYGDFMNSRFGHGLQLGIGISYNLIQF